MECMTYIAIVFIVSPPFLYIRCKHLETLKGCKENSWIWQ